MLVQLLKHMFNARLTYVILFLSVFLIGLPAEALQAQHRKTSDLPFKELMQQAQLTWVWLIYPIISHMPIGFLRETW